MATRLDLAYRAQIQSVRDRVEGFARAQFVAGEFRDRDVERFVSTVVPVVLAGRRQVSALTDAYLSTVLTAAVGRKVRASGPIDTDGLRGVPAAEVYERPFKTVRWKLAQGLSLDAAVSAGLARASDLTKTDMQLAKTHTTRAKYTRTPEVTAFRRVLVGPDNCGLCYVASTQRYHKGDLNPIHPGCNCDTAPIIDTGEQVIDADRLQATHEAFNVRFGADASDARGVDYRKALLVEEHGELGPVLTVRSHRFTGESDLT